MSTAEGVLDHSSEFPVRIEIEPALTDRNRLTTFFRLILAVPHVLLVGGPAAFVYSWANNDGVNLQWGSGGIAGIVIGLISVAAWVAILVTGRHPKGLWDLAVYYVRWRVRVAAYMGLLRDEYPPFGDDDYPASALLSRPTERDRLTVGFRMLLALPHLIVVGVLTCVWALTTMIAWWMIMFTGRFPATLYDFGVGVLRWHTRVEAYVLLLRDEYPPFSFE